MQTKMIWWGMFFGSMLGSYAPTLWGDNAFLSLTSVFTSAIGAFLGIWIAFKISH